MSVIAEWTMLEHESSLFMDDQAWMVSAAKRMDDMAMHVTYSTQKDEFDSGLEGTIQEQLPLQEEETSITLGLRYDYDSSTALKFEVQNNDEKTAAGVDGDSATLYSVAVDIVF
jgi:predicted porin